ncbi:MFS transporter [Paenibacillus cisolokensis]|uniref:MFS transporter n=1 Tax=Paenibacillus cisolokensis TaxID=1658519 RepID=UPI003D299058
MPPLFRNRVFLIVAGADLLQQIGIWVRNMALLFYIMEQTGNNPTAVALLTALEYLPIFVFSMIGGTLADRWNPKKTVIIGDSLSAVSIVVILGLVSAGWWQAAFAATVVSAVVSQFSQPSSSVLFKRHVPEELIGAAIGITQSQMAIFMIGGPILGTLIYSRLGIEASLGVLIAVFALAALIQLALPSSPRDTSPAPSPLLRDMREGIRYVAGKPNLRLTAVMFLLVGCATGITQPLDVFVTMERLGLAKEAVQWFEALAGVGLLAGGIIAAVFSGIVDRHRSLIIPLALMALSIGTVIEVLSLWPVLTGSVRFLLGIIMTFFQIVFGALIIKEVDEAYIGRTNGAIVPLMMGGILIGSAISGLLAEISLFAAYGVSAALTAAGAALATRLRTTDAAKHTPTHAENA